MYTLIQIYYHKILIWDFAYPLGAQSLQQDNLDIVKSHIDRLTIEYPYFKTGLRILANELKELPQQGFQTPVAGVIKKCKESEINVTKGALSRDVERMQNSTSTKHIHKKKIRFEEEEHPHFDHYEATEHMDPSANDDPDGND